MMDAVKEGLEQTDKAETEGRKERAGTSTVGEAASDEEEDFSLKFPKEYHNKSLQN